MTTTTPTLTLYTIGCPKCKQLERQLNSAAIPYTTCTDINIMKSKGMTHVPMLEVEGKLLDFTAALRYVTEYMKSKENHESNN